jgi:hypothetical protein
MPIEQERKTGPHSSLAGSGRHLAALDPQGNAHPCNSYLAWSRRQISVVPVDHIDEIRHFLHVAADEANRVGIHPLDSA